MNVRRGNDGEDAPEHVVARAVRIFGAVDAQPATAGHLGRIVASLRFDSAQHRPAFGTRGASQASARHMVFNAAPYDLELHVERSEMGWVVGGQVLGPCSGGQVIAMASDVRSETTLNDLCEFSLPALSEGEFTLLVRLSDGEIEVPGLVLEN